MFRTELMRRGTLVLAGVVLLAASACSYLFGPDHDPYYFAMLIDTEGQPPLAIYADGSLSGSGLSIPVGVATRVSMRFINKQGLPALSLTTQEFRASVVPSAGIIFERAGGFWGTLTGAAAGVVDVRFGLFHVEADHHDFGLFTVPVTIVP